MSEQRGFGQLRQAGFTRVEEWDKEWFKEEEQKALLGVIADDPQTTELE